MKSNNSPSNLKNITLQSNFVPSEEADISPERAITDMVSRYPRPCPMGKRGEWVQIFQSNVIDLAHELFEDDTSPAITLVNRILKGFIERSAKEQSSRILGPEKFFEKWVPGDFGLQRLRQRAAQRKESDYGDYLSGEAEVDGLDETPTTQKFDVDELGAIEDA
jgi:hypothetical protein